MIWPPPTMYQIDLYIGNGESAAILPALQPQYCCPDKNCFVFLWVCKIERSTVGINCIQWGQRCYPFVFTWCQGFREHINLFVNIFMHACMAIVGSKYTFSMIWPPPTMYHIDLYIGNGESAAILPALQPQYCCPDKIVMFFCWFAKLKGLLWVSIASSGVSVAIPLFSPGVRFSGNILIYLSTFLSCMHGNCRE